MPHKTISTTSIVAASVILKPSIKLLSIFNFLSISPIWGPPPWTTIGSIPTCCSSDTS